LTSPIPIPSSIRTSGKLHPLSLQCLLHKGQVLGWILPKYFKENQPLKFSKEEKKRKTMLKTKSATFHLKSQIYSRNMVLFDQMDQTSTHQSLQTIPANYFGMNKTENHQTKTI